MENLLAEDHWIKEGFSERMTYGQWNRVLLSRAEVIDFNGKPRRLIAKKLGYGIYEVFKEPLDGSTIRCGAYARTTGAPCTRRAMANGRCSMHGGLSTGPKTKAGKKKSQANLKQFRASRQKNTEREPSRRNH